MRSDWRSGLEWVRMRVLVLQMQDIQSPPAQPLPASLPSTLPAQEQAHGASRQRLVYPGLL